MSQTAKPGRRTPLSLGSNKSNKNSTESQEKPNSRSSTPVITDKKNSEIIVDQKPKGQPEVATNPKQSENNQKNGTSPSNTKSENGSAKEEKQKSIASKEDKSKSKVDNVDNKSSPKENKDIKIKSPASKDDNTKGKSENVDNKDKTITDKEKSTNGGSKLNDSIGEKSENKPKEIRESPRQKELKAKEREEQEKAEQEKAEQQKTEQEKAKIAKDNVQVIVSAKETLELPAVVVTPATPESNTANETPKTKELSKAKDSPKIKNAESETKSISLDDTNSQPIEGSILSEKDMKGFNSYGEEMESLIMEPEIEDSPMPKTKPASKILKYNQGPPAKALISPFRRSDKTKNASTIVNLSTVSEQSTEAGSILTSHLSEELTYGSSLRLISGRKSTRPLRELSIQHSMRESYRKLQSDFNDTNSSMNVTVGSEIPNESFRTPVVAVKGQARKRTAFEEEESNLKESPKKPRLDISGFLGFVVSPVTMLRAKFQRSKLQCSTPNEKLIDQDETINMECNENINVSGIESEIIDVVVMDEDISEAKEVLPDDVDEINDIKNSSKDEMIDELKYDIEEVPIEYREPKKSRCNVM